MEVGFKDDYVKSEPSEGQSTADTARRDMIAVSYVSFGETNNKILVDREILQIINEGPKKSKKQMFLSEQEKAWAANTIWHRYKEYKERKLRRAKKLAGWIILKVEC